MKTHTPPAVSRDLRLLPALALLIGAVGCDPAAPGPSPAGARRVYTTFYPTTYLARRLAGTGAEVTCPLPPDEDPIFWQPPGSVITEYQAADLVIVNGAGLEQWVETTTLPRDRLVDTARRFSDSFLRYETVTHSHGPEGDHTHEGLDGHTWLDPRLALDQARSIREGLERILPDRVDSLREAFEALARDLEDLHARLEELSPQLKGRPLLASHPAYNYLARRYGWDVHNLDLDPEELPAPEALAEIERVLKGHPAKILLWEGPPAPEVSAALAERFGLESVVYSPAENPAPSRLETGTDFLAIQLENVDRLAAALAKE